MEKMMEERQISRRLALKAGLYIGIDLILESQGIGLLTRGLCAKEYANTFQRYGKLVVVPNSGSIYVARWLRHCSCTMEKRPVK